MAGWRIVDFSDFQGSLRYQRGQLLVCPEEGAQVHLPLADLALVLVGLKVSMSAAVLHQLAEFDVAVLICGWNGVPVASSLPWNRHTRVGARQLAQAKVSAPSRKNAWGRIIKAKIAGQHANLRLLRRPEWSVLKEMSAAVRSGDPDNLEAQAARHYWPRLFDAEPGFSRNPGGGAGRNALLDYGYTVLRGHAIRAVMSAGLSGALGLFHRGRSNPFNLADDLIEPFRPVVDLVVATLPENASLEHPSVKQALVGASSRPFTSEGYSAATELMNLAQRLGRYFEGEVSKLKVPVWEPSLDGLDG